jgi:DNA-binding NarL/FixJ family response regulator
LRDPVAGVPVLTRDLEETTQLPIGNWMSLHVVIVEDHQALRQGLELLLASRGCTVVGSVGTAPEGLEVICATRPQVAVVDIRLGEPDGIWLTREVLVRHPAQAILLYTGTRDEQLLYAGLDSGARGIALKDGTPDELMEALSLVSDGGSYLDPRVPAALRGRRDGHTRAGLSRRERQIMDLLARGLTGEQVAERLVLSSETIKTHVRNAMQKLDATTRVHAIAIALREGYIDPPGRAPGALEAPAVASRFPARSL